MMLYEQLILFFGVILILPNFYKCYHIHKNDVISESDEIFKNNFYNSDDDKIIWNKSWTYINRNMKKCLFKEHYQQHHIQNHDHNFTVTKSSTKWKDTKEISISLLFTNRWLNCFNMTSLKLFDFITKLKVISLMNGIQLVQIQQSNNDLSTFESHHGLKELNDGDARNKTNETSTSKFRNNSFKKWVDPVIDYLKTNLMNTVIASKMATIKSNKINEINSKKNINQYNMRVSNIDQLHKSEESLLPSLSSLSSTSSSTSSIQSTESSFFLSISWLLDILKKINNMLTTHVLQINFDKLIDNHNNIDNNNHNNDENNEFNNKNTDMVTGRHRHRRNNMMMAMMFGVTAMGAIVIPVGFQFLSVVAGKALLLSKMALMLASISSLRKIATSGLHYGLYHIPETYGAGFGGYFDRGDNHNQPRFPRNIS